jgi:hypothetical protein
VWGIEQGRERKVGFPAGLVHVDRAAAARVAAGARLHGAALLGLRAGALAAVDLLLNICARPRPSLRPPERNDLSARWKRASDDLGGANAPASNNKERRLRFRAARPAQNAARMDRSWNNLAAPAVNP